MPRPQLRLLVLFAGLVIALLTSCSTGTSGSGKPKATLPDGAQLLADSATAMRTVTTAHLIVDVQGKVPGVPLRSADVRLTQEGSFTGTAKINQGNQGQVLEAEFAVIGDKLYLRLPPAPTLQRSASELAAVYDPRQILNPAAGVASVLASGTGATTEAREQVDGVDSYRVRANFPASARGTLLPGLAQDTTGQIWIAVQGSRLVQAQFPATDGTITVHMSEYDAPVQITPPA